MNHVFQQIRDFKCFQASVANELKEIGLKAPKYRKQSAKPQENVRGGTVFGGYLCHAPCTTVTMQGFTLNVPKFLLDATSVIRKNIRVEGIFRKAGSVHRQTDIKRVLEKSGVLTAVDVHDAANLLKQFLRHLTVPLIPRQFHEALLKALDLTGATGRRKVSRREAVLLVCLLLPTEHLHVLRFVMDFFAQVAANSAHNKMDLRNLATVLTPNIFVLQSDYDRKDKDKTKGQYLQKQTGLVQFLIENADHIGWVPDHVLESSVYCSSGWMGGALSEDDLDGSRDGLTDGGGPRSAISKKSRKKRNSINGVFSGLRRMVQSNRVPTTCYDDDNAGGAEFHMTPFGSLKRKHDLPGEDEEPDAQHSSSKKRAVERSTKGMPLPFHLDSPDPYQREDSVSLTPAPSFLLKDVIIPRSQTRKSGRIKFFKRRNSPTQTPKCKKEPKNRLTASSKKQICHSSNVGRRLSGEDLQTSPVLLLASPGDHLAVTPFQMRKSLQSTKSKSSFTSYIQCESGSVAEVCATQVPVPAPPPTNVTAAKDVPCQLTEAVQEQSVATVLSDALDRVAICSIDGKTVVESSPTHEPTYRVDLPKPRDPTVTGLISASGTIRRSSRKGARRSVSLRTQPPPPSTDFGSPVDRFVRPWHNKSSLRRGRPNTVTTGLPAPSPFKTGTHPPFTQSTSAIEMCNHPEGGSQATVVDTEQWLHSRSAAPTSMTKEAAPSIRQREHSPFDVLAAGKISKKLEFSVGEAMLEFESPVPSLIKIDSGILCDDHITEAVVADSVSDADLAMFGLDYANGDKEVMVARGGISRGDCPPISVNLPMSTSRDSGVERSMADLSSVSNDLQSQCHCSVLVSDMGDANRGGSTPSVASLSTSLTNEITPNATSAKLPIDANVRMPLTISGLPDSVAWRNAESVINELKARCANSGNCVGRPSLIRLMKDKAGLVSQTARRYESSGPGSVIASQPKSAVIKSGSPIRIPDIFRVASPRTSTGRSSDLRGEMASGSTRWPEMAGSVMKTRDLYRTPSSVTPTRRRRQPSANSVKQIATLVDISSKENENCTPTRPHFKKRSGGGTPLQNTRTNSNCKGRARPSIVGAKMVGRSKSLKVTGTIRSPLSTITAADRVASHGSLRRSPRLQEIQFRSGSKVVNHNHHKKKEATTCLASNTITKRRSDPRRSTSM